MPQVINEINSNEPRCPYCNGLLEPGYLQSFRQIYFNRGKKARLFAPGDLRSINLSDLGVLRSPGVKALYCDRCKKIIIDVKK